MYILLDEAQLEIMQGS